MQPTAGRESSWRRSAGDGRQGSMKCRTVGMAGRYIAPAPRGFESGRMSPKADYTHTIYRWDAATGENLIERIAGVSDYLAALEAYGWR